MSRTMQRNGGVIEQAARGCATSSQFNGMFTIREVASRAGVSKPTAARYLDILVSYGVLDTWRYIGTNMRYFKFVRGSAD